MDVIDHVRLYGQWMLMFPFYDESPAEIVFVGNDAHDGGDSFSETFTDTIRDGIILLP